MSIRLLSDGPPGATLQGFMKGLPHLGLSLATAIVLMLDIVRAGTGTAERV